MGPSSTERHKRRWTSVEDNKLIFHWDKKSIREIARLLERTPHAVHQRARTLGIRAEHREGMTLRQFSRYSGFAPAKIYATAKILNINLRRALAFDGTGIPRCSKLNISEDVQARLLEFMLVSRAPSNLKSQRGIRGVWGTGQKPDACLDCSRSEVPHYSTGRCRACWKKYNKLMRSERDVAIPPGLSRVSGGAACSQRSGEARDAGSSDLAVLVHEARSRDCAEESPRPR